MNSKTKYKITNEQVAKIFETAGFGTPTAVKPLDEGWYNSVVIVAVDKAKYVLKVAPHPSVAVLTYEEGIMTKELKYYALLREKTNINTPKILLEDFTRTVIPCDYFVMEFLEGSVLDKIKLSPEEKKRVDGEILQILAQHHAITGEGFGYEQMGLERNWYLALKKMNRAMIDDCRRFGKSCPLGKKLNKYIEQHREILESVSSQFVNYDLHGGNIMYCEGKLFVFDLERAFWGDYTGDFIARALTPPQSFTREEKIRFYLLMGYLAVMMYTEKFSRYTPFNKIWWLDVGGTILYGDKAFGALRRI
ncbi:MAG: aminoglycoside phosphotransferase family protein [Oscillospiraceae bacterium]|nr:aminoglycoside phosphotransferase family protein [Oscillospiraceae bacterium]